MIKSELIQKLAYDHPHLFHKDVERIVNVVFDEIIAAMARGDRVELRGFGAFSVVSDTFRVPFISEDAFDDYQIFVSFDGSGGALPRSKRRRG